MRARRVARPAPALTGLLRPAAPASSRRGGGATAMLEMWEATAEDRAGIGKLVFGLWQRSFERICRPDLSVKGSKPKFVTRHHSTGSVGFDG